MPGLKTFLVYVRRKRALEWGCMQGIPEHAPIGPLIHQFIINQRWSEKGPGLSSLREIGKRLPYRPDEKRHAGGAPHLPRDDYIDYIICFGSSTAVQEPPLLTSTFIGMMVLLFSSTLPSTRAF